MRKRPTTAIQSRYDDQVLERFIPVSLEDLLQKLCDENQPQVCALHQLLVAHYRHDTLLLLADLRRDYQPFNPDRDTLEVAKPGQQEAIDTIQVRFLEALHVVLNNANFEPLPDEQLQSSLQCTPAEGVEVQVNFDAIDEFQLFYRGTALRTVKQRHWRDMFRQRSVDMSIYKRLVLIVKPHQEPPTPGRSAPILIKLFKDIPHADLETLFPDSKIRIRLRDKVQLTVTGGGGTVSGILATLTKVTLASNAFGIVVAIGGFAALLWRQIAKVFHARTHYMARLVSNLYFYNMDNNQGALTYLVELGAVAECKEVLLAYDTLHRNPGLTSAALDREIEGRLSEWLGVAVDFEIEDGLRKLRERGLLQEEDGLLSVVEPDVALHSLQQQWRERC